MGPQTVTTIKIKYYIDWIDFGNVTLKLKFNSKIEHLQRKILEIRKCNKKKYTQLQTLNT